MGGLKTRLKITAPWNSSATRRSAVPGGVVHSSAPARALLSARKRGFGSCKTGQTRKKVTGVGDKVMFCVRAADGLRSLKYIKCNARCTAMTAEALHGRRSQARCPLADVKFQNRGARLHCSRGVHALQPKDLLTI